MVYYNRYQPLYLTIYVTKQNLIILYTLTSNQSVERFHLLKSLLFSTLHYRLRFKDCFVMFSLYKRDVCLTNAVTNR